MEENDNVVILNTKKNRTIFEAKTFIDDDGRTVIGRIPISDKNISPSYSGAFMVGTNMGPIRLNFDFPEGTNLNECFEQFDDFAKKTFEEEKAKAEAKNKIVTPGQSNGGIIMP